MALSTVSSLRLPMGSATRGGVVCCVDPRRDVGALVKDSDGVLSPRSLLQTGTMDVTTTGATQSFTQEPLTTEKQVVFIRHGMSTWNAEGRIQVLDDRLYWAEIWLGVF